MRMPLVVLIAAAAAMMIASTNTETPTSQESVIRWSGTVTVRFRETAVGSTFYRCGRPHGNRTIEYKTDNARWYEAVYKVVLRERESLLDLESGEVTWTFGEVWNEKGRCEGEDYVQARLGTSGVETMQPERRVGHIWEDKVGEKTVQRYRVGIEVRKDMGGDWVEKSDKHYDNWPALVKTRGNHLRLPHVVAGADNPTIPGGGRWLIQTPWETRGFKWGPFELKNNGTLMQHSWSDSVTVHVRRPFPDSMAVTHSAHLSWDLRKEGEEPVEVEVTPAEKGWRPEWQPEKGGNVVGITATIVKPDGAEGLFRFTLYDISAEPGWCMNAGDQTDPDLDLEPVDGDFTGKREENTNGERRRILDTSTPARNAQVGVVALDNGAFGRLMVEAKVNGTWYRARAQETLADHVTIPRDDNLNRIADDTKWDLDGAPGEDDKEEYPPGDDSKGDGLSNYEEYRGFNTYTGWQATGPKVKELFVARDATDIDIGLFGPASELHVIPLTISQTGGDDGRIINFNHATQRFHVVDQHAIKVVWGDLGDIVAGLTYYCSAEFPMPSSTSPGRTYVTEPLSPDDVVQVVINRTEKTASDMSHTVAHELGHAVAIQHHGKGIEYVSGADLASAGVADWVVRSLGTKNKYCVALWRGEYSGDINCLMRYDYADMYRWKDDHYYPYPNKLVTPGTSFCDKQGGTGINGGADSTQTVLVECGGGVLLPVQIMIPVCGDGTPDTGCRYQIHVSDAR